MSVENAEEEEANRPFFLKTEVLATVAGIIFIFGFTAALFIVHCARKKVREQQQQRDESRSGRRNGRRNGGRRGGIGSSERSSRAAPVQSTEPPGYGTLPGNSGNGGNQGNVNVDALFPADERGGRGLRIPASLQVDLPEYGELYPTETGLPGYENYGITANDVSHGPESEQLPTSTTSSVHVLPTAPRIVDQNRSGVLV